MSRRIAAAVVICLSALGFAAPVAAAPAEDGYFSSDTSGCPGLTLFVPFTDHLTAPVTGLTTNLLGAVNRQLDGVKKVSGKPAINWLTQARCQAAPAENDVQSPASRSSDSGLPPETGNWSGFWQGVPNATEVSQSWRVPALNAGGKMAQQMDSTIWPGIGNGRNLVQAGTTTNGSCTAPNACHMDLFSFWYEALPDLQTEQLVTNLPIQAGNQVSSTVGYDYNRHAMSWTLCNDSLNTCVNGNYKMQGNTDPGNTIEFIAERSQNSLDHSLLGLNNFGDLTISNVSYKSADGSGSLSNAHPITMISCDQSTLAEPGQLSAGGSSFVDHWRSYGQIDQPNCLSTAPSET
ncbi:MAG: G1 family glutamic endopeptidase [Candidatus Dormibacteraceae bacterium]